MERLYYLTSILILVIADMFISSIGILEYGLYESSWIHRWGFREFGKSYTLLGVAISFAFIFLITEIFGTFFEYYQPENVNFYFLVVYIGIISVYALTIFLNMAYIYFARRGCL